MFPGSDLQKKKWRNIRDSYRKHWKSIKSTKSGQARKDKKQYVYANQLFFLDDTMELGPTEASPNVSTPNAPNTEENCDEDELQSEDESSSRSTPKSRGSSASSMYRHAKKGLQSKIEKYIDSFEAYKKQKCDKDDGDDLNFFKSLLPVVEPWPLQEKLKFRIEVMNLAMEYAERNRAHAITHVALPDNQLPTATHTYKQTVNPPLTLKNKAPKRRKNKQQENAASISEPHSPADLHTLQSVPGSSKGPDGQQMFFSDVLSAARLQMYGQPRDCYTPGAMSFSSNCDSELTENQFDVEDFP